jgi:AcrR family transcriptional regulator
MAAEQPVPRVSVREQYKVLTRQRIVEAAAAEFEEQGYSACTIEDISRRAGTSRATFYTYFGSKAEIVEGLWDVRRRTLLGLYKDLAALPVRDEVTIAAWLGRTFEWWGEHRLLLLAILEAVNIEPMLSEAYVERITQVSEMVAPLVSTRHHLTPESAMMRALLLTIQHERFCYFWLLRKVPLDHDEAMHTMTELWVEQLGNAEAGQPSGNVLET